MTPYKPELLRLIEKHFGAPPQVRALSDEIEIAIVPGREMPTGNEKQGQTLRSYNAVFTLGLSAQPMQGALDDSWRFAELVLLLPSDWPLENTPENWPLRWLNTLALMPSRSHTRLGLIHSVPNGDPPQPLAQGTDFCGWLLIAPLELPRQFARLKMKDGEILNLLTPIALYKDELYVKINQGAGGLLELLTRAGVSDIFDPQRPSVFDKKKRKGLFRR